MHHWESTLSGFQHLYEVERNWKCKTLYREKKSTHNLFYFNHRLLLLNFVRFNLLIVLSWCKQHYYSRWFGKGRNWMSQNRKSNALFCSVLLQRSPWSSPSAKLVRAAVCVVEIKQNIINRHRLFCCTFYLGDFTTNTCLPKTPQHWISVSCSLLARANVKHQRVIKRLLSSRSPALSGSKQNTAWTVHKLLRTT